MLRIAKAKRIVIKVGSSTLTHDTGKLNLKRIESLCRVISDLKNEGREIVLVTSGAVAAGLSKMGFDTRPNEIQIKQAAAAVGQCELMYLYDKMFSEYAHITAQVLLTKNIVDDSVGRTNVINTFETLFKLKTIPIVNENDTVSYEEIEIGDNDTLSAIVASLCNADALVILSDIDGLYDKNPKSATDANLIPIVYNIDSSIRALAGGTDSSVGTGGMITKIRAAEIATQNGIDMVIANGQDPAVLYDIFEGKPIGTIFLAKENIK